MTLFELIQKGGWSIYPLLVCSFLMWAVVFERFYTLRKWLDKNKAFLLSVSNLILKGKLEEAKALCEKSNRSSSTDLAELCLIYLSENQSKTATIKAVRKRLELANDLKKYLWVLGTIGSSSPFIGLFGTVVGIMNAFESIAKTGSGGFAVVAAGISEALVATAAGILVAVIAVVFFNYFQVKVSQYQFHLKLMSEELNELFYSKSSVE